MFCPFSCAPIAGAAVLSFVFPISFAAAGPISADSVVAYSPGSPIQTAWWDPNLTFDHADSALGLPNSDVGNDPYTGRSTGAMTPFNPPFMPQDIVRISAGGSLELHLSSAVQILSGHRELGVFVNNGIADVTPGTNYDSNFVCISGGTGTAGAFQDNPSEILFAPPPRALVYVKSAINDPWTQVGTGPITFENPTNAFTDTLIDKLVAPPGSQPADDAKPFTGTLADFAGKTYPQMLTMLNGSAGGTWLDLDSTGLSQVQYVKFEVPQGADYRMVLDSVSGVPEPACLGLLILGGSVLTRRRFVR
jgi:hypothetical protein